MNKVYSRLSKKFVFVSKIYTKLHSNRGFTLIELLVVIAIIGILAAVIIPNLSDSRLKATDAAIMSQLKSAQTQAEIFGQENDSDYTGVCDDSEVVLLLNGASQSYNRNNNEDVCNDSDAAWAAYVLLRLPPSDMAGWCIDSEGNAKASTELGNATVCP